MKYTEPDLTTFDEVCNAMMQNPMLGFCVLQNDRIVFINPALCTMSGYIASFIYGLGPSGFLDLIDNEDRAKADSDYRNLLSGSVSTTRQTLRILHKDGTPLWFDIFSSMAPWHGTSAIHVFGVDVSERITAAQALKDTRDELERRIQQRTADLADANIYMESVLNSSQDGILVIDEDGRFEYVNPAFLKISGRRSEDLIGKGFMQLIPPEQHRLILNHWNEVQHDIAGQYETDIIHGEGSKRTILVTQQRVVIGGMPKYCLTVKDMTEKRQAEEELQNHQLRLETKIRERTAALVEINARLSKNEAALARAQATARIGSWEWDTSRNKPEWSREMFRLHGLTPEQGEPTIDEILRLTHPGDRDIIAELLQKSLTEGSSFQAEYRIVKADGTVTEMLTRGQGSKATHGKRLRLSGTLQDITERRKLEREIVEASQNEQQRIGRDLHDTLGQEMTGLALLAKVLENKISKIVPHLATNAADLSRIASLSASHARDIAHGLSPVDIAEEGLSAELRNMSSRVQSLYGIDCRFTATGDERVHDNAVATHLYHIVQEAVTNAVKHASPSCITVHMTGGAIGALIITNDGPSKKNSAEKKGGGVGLRIMRHRADIIGAKLNIEPLAKNGTRVTCTFPNRSR